MNYGNSSPDEIDIFAHPNTETMFHRYLLASHWCKDKDVFDVACGYGYGSHVLKTFAKSVTGMDADPKAIEFAKKQYPYINFLNEEILESKMVNGFDTIVSIETMEHLPRHQVELYLQKLNSWVKEGGTVFITTPNRANTIFNYKRNQSHLYEYSVDEFIEIVMSNFKGDFKFLSIQEVIMGHRNEIKSVISPYLREVHIIVAVVENVHKY